MPPPDTLLTYPYVIVRIGCDACDCKHWGHSHPYRFRCQARFRDLEPPRRPPDLPAMRLRVVKGGKS